VSDELWQVSRKLRVFCDDIDCSFYGPAFVVAQDHDHKGAQHGRPEFDAGEPIVVDKVAGQTHHEQSAACLVERQLGCNPRIGAP
jgi:hypothetical protein